MSANLAVLVCALAVAGLLASQARGSRAGVWVAKPLASTAFVVAAIGWGALGSAYGRTVLLALVLCWIGDVLLIPRGRRGPFLAGLTSFLLGHVALAVAFLGGAAHATVAGVAALALVPVGWLVLRWLGPHLSGPMRVAVFAYVAVILAMVAAATAHVWAAFGAAALVGAVLFAVSDLAVARERFVAPGFANAAWGLPLYYAATLTLASTVR